MTVRLYGKATGPGPWHLLSDKAAVRALCGRKVHYHGTVIPYGTAGRVCPSCRAAERRAACDTAKAPTTPEGNPR